MLLQFLIVNIVFAFEKHLIPDTDENCINLICQYCISNNKCILCLDNFFVNAQEKCQRCPALCKQCNQQKTCLKCIDGYGFSSNGCEKCLKPFAKLCNTIYDISQCQNGLYYLQFNQCKPCRSINCKICISGGCYSCIQGYKLQGTICTRIQNLPQNCYHCQGNTACLCNKNCNDGYYYNNRTNTCYLVTNKNQGSLLCKDALIGEDYDNCPKGCSDFAYQQFLTNSSLCIPYTFSSTQQITIYKKFTSGSHNTSKFKQINLTQPNKFIAEIQIGGYYSIGVFFWLNLKPNSLSLDITDNNTQSSQYNKVFSDSQLKDKRKFSIDYINLINQRKLKITLTSNVALVVNQFIIQTKLCFTGCLKCRSALNCEICDSPLFMQRNKCVLACQNIYASLFDKVTLNSCVQTCPLEYYKQDQTCKICLNGSGECLTCRTQIQCLSCDKNSQKKYYFAKEKKCLENCVIQDYQQYFYLNQEQKNCQSCKFPCLACISQKQCLNCSFSNYFLLNTTCTISCNQISNLYYSNYKTKTCQLCNVLTQNCKQCTQLQCTKCQQNFYFLNNKCFSSCPDGFYKNQTQLLCKACQRNCIKCQINNTNNQLQCDQCQVNFYKCNNKCQINCQNCPTTYQDHIKKNCSSCTKGCKICTSANDCSKCQDDQKYLKGNLCCSSCNCIDVNDPCCQNLNQFYPQTSKKVCLQCKTPCSTCLSQDQCLSCVYNYLDNQTHTCVQNCDDNHYPNQSFVCVSCEKPCKTCLTKITCLQCLDDDLYLTENQQCVKNCPDRYYKNVDEKKCYRCINYCQICNNSQNCTQCYDNYFLRKDQKCYLHCQYDQRKFIQNGTCGNCSIPNCNICYVNQKYQELCTKCYKNSYLFQSKCQNSCPDQYYMNTNLNRCNKCILPCLTCNSSTYCITCNNKILNISDHKCYDCPPYTFYDQNQCLNCSANCIKCNNQTFCIQCHQTFYLYQNRCVENCSQLNQHPLFTYFNNKQIRNRCSLCIYPCKTCQDQFSCLSCRVNFLQQNKCVYQCKNSFFANQNTNQCEPCDINCKECQNQNTNCIQCNDNKYLQKNQCVDNCQGGWFQLNDKICEQCISPCQTCSTNSQNCTSCIESTILMNNNCLTFCPDGFYQNQSTKICDKCSDNCSLCTDINNCIYCIQTFYIKEGNCSDDCGEYYYKNQEFLICSTCSEKCLKCNSLDNCSECQNGSILFEQYCIDQCPNGYFKDNLKCKLCNQSSLTNCFSCILQNSILICTLCSEQTFMNSNNTQCVTQCHPDTFGNIYTRKCQNCIIPCKTCQFDAINCRSCTDSPKFKLVQKNSTVKQCFQTQKCPDQRFLNPSKDSCVIICPVQNSIVYYRDYLKGQCVQNCSNDYFKNSLKSCIKSCINNQYGNSSFFCYSCNVNSSVFDCNNKYKFQVALVFNYSRLMIRFNFNQQTNYAEELIQDYINLKFDQVQQKRILKTFVPQFKIIDKKIKNMIILIKPDDTIGQTYITIELPITNITRKNFQFPSSGFLAERSSKIYLKSYTKYSQKDIEIGQNKLYYVSLYLTSILLVISLSLICIGKGAASRHIVDMLNISWILAYVSLGQVVNIQGWIRGFRGGIWGFVKYVFGIRFPINAEGQPYGRFGVVNQDVMFLNNADFLIIVFLLIILIAIILKIINIIKRKKNSVYIQENQEITNKVILNNQNQKQNSQSKQNISNSTYILSSQNWIGYFHDLLYTIHLPLFFFSIAQFRDLNNYNSYSSLSITFSFIFFILLLSIPIFVSLYIFMNNKILLNQGQGIPTFINHVKNKVGLNLILFRYFRNIFIAVIIIALMNWPQFIIGLICTLSLFFSIIVLAYSPFRLSLEGYYYVACQLILTLKCILISILIIFDQFSIQAKLVIGWIAIALSIILLLLLLAYMIAYLVLFILGKYLNKNLFKLYQDSNQSQTQENVIISQKDKEQNVQKAQKNIEKKRIKIQQNQNEQEVFEEENYQNKNLQEIDENQDHQFRVYSEEDFNQKQTKNPQYILKCINIQSIQ